MLLIYIIFSCFIFEDCFHSRNLFLSIFSPGTVRVLDLRAKVKSSAEYSLHDKKIGCIDWSYTDQNLFATRFFPTPYLVFINLNQF